MSDPTEITFSTAYERLKSITDTLNAEEVEADALVPLLRDGKGLEAALRAHLDQVEQDVRAIESGEGITAYRIVSSAGGSSPEAAPGDDQIPF